VFLDVIATNALMAKTRMGIETSQKPVTAVTAPRFHAPHNAE
jgi:hypothetical protein